MKKDIRIHITKDNELYINDILIISEKKNCVDSCKRIIEIAVNYIAKCYTDKKL